MTFDAGNRQTSAKFTGNSATLRFDDAGTVRDQVESISRYNDLAGSTKIGSTSFVYDTRMQVMNICHHTGAGFEA